MEEEGNLPKMDGDLFVLGSARLDLLHLRVCPTVREIESIKHLGKSVYPSEYKAAESLGPGSTNRTEYMA